MGNNITTAELVLLVTSEYTPWALRDAAADVLTKRLTGSTPPVSDTSIEDDIPF
jgi:hypothetical protein